MQSSSVRSLYKKILRGVQSFPSKNKDKLYTEIKLDFRSNKNLKGPALQTRLKEATEGLKQLKSYQFNEREGNWEVKSTQEPMPHK
ncbi:hypothetical protein TrRE_jg10200 [Triparma retinervis]|uniref:Complex 1 LYR protein domain-containing protein n=1 Tax=Triparma retinervis TaxID=2557542 RepID=A0A9W6ZRC5_9STRA|nr:hypothetical protein TrRE_jg873 [Triparma retinervis]GMH55179.1 hypothetical protein TrRE_jg10200 [Triparma retinervis]